MALGKPNRQFEGKSYSLQFKLKDGEKFVDQGYFLVQQPTGEKDANGKNKYEDVGRETDVNGDLVSISTDVRDTEKGTVRSFTLALNDADKKETYFTRFGLGSRIGRRTANAILNLSTFNNVQLGSYTQVNKETKEKYPDLSVRQGNSTATVKGKYNLKGDDVMPKPREFEGVGGKKQNDYTAQEVLLIEKLKEFAKVVQEAAKNRRANTPVQQQQSAPAQHNESEAHEPTGAAGPLDEEADLNPPF